MLRNIVFVTTLLMFASAGYGASPEEKKAEVLHQARELVKHYGGMSDPDTLARMNRQIERTWQNFTQLFGTDSKLATKFAYIRAKSATAAKQQGAVSNSWRQAIKLLPASSSGSLRLAYYTQAANASATVKDFDSASQFFAAARVFASVRGKGADQAKLYLKIQELKISGEGMEWRRLNDSLLDMRKYAENFVSWSIPHLDALLGETEVRLLVQPEGAGEKRAVLGALKAKIILVQKGMNGAIPPMQIDRIRALFYALEDNYDL